MLHDSPLPRLSTNTIFPVTNDFLDINHIHMNPLIHFSLLFDMNIVICYKIVEIFWQILNILSIYLLDYQISYTIQATTMYKTLTKQYNSYIFSDKITRLNRFSCALIINGVDKKIVDLATVEKPNKSC